MVHGCSGAHAEEAFSVSRDTVKAHVRYVYAKLGVHTQQELIDPFESMGHFR